MPDPRIVAMRAQDVAAGRRGRERDRRVLGQLAAERLREARRVAVIHRPVPAQDVSHPRSHERADERLAELGPGLRRAARREEHERRLVLAERACDVAGSRELELSLGRL